MLNSIPGWLGSQLRGDVADIGRRDVPGIGPRMNGNAGRASRDADADGFGDARQVPAARVSQRGDLVHIDAELGQRSSPQLLLHLPGDLRRPRLDFLLIASPLT